MKTMHKFLAVVISAALAAGLLAGCGAASSTASSAASSEAVSSVACTQIETIGECAFYGDFELRLFKIGTEIPPTPFWASPASSAPRIWVLPRRRPRTTVPQWPRRRSAIYGCVPFLQPFFQTKGRLIGRCEEPRLFINVPDKPVRPPLLALHIEAAAESPAGSQDPGCRHCRPW